MSRSALLNIAVRLCGPDALIGPVADTLSRRVESVSAAAGPDYIAAPPLPDALIVLPGADAGSSDPAFREALAAFPAPVALLGGAAAGLEPGGRLVRFDNPCHISALLRWLSACQAHRARRPVRIGAFAFDPRMKVLMPVAGGDPVSLTEKEAAILARLVGAGGAAVRRDELLQEVWGYDAGQIATHTLETHIYQLRRKLEVDDGMAGVLATESDGYRLALPPPAD